MAAIIEKLDRAGEKILTENLGSGENILAKLQGSSGQAIVITDQHLYLLKWGITTGHRCNTLDYRDIAGIDIRKTRAISGSIGVLDVSAPALKETLSNVFEEGLIWKALNPSKHSRSEIAFPLKKLESFQQAVAVARDLIEKHRSAHESSGDIAALEKLADLKNKGIITEEEFTAKKKQILKL